VTEFGLHVIALVSVEIDYCSLCAVINYGNLY